jgi:excisionase family DNA binding protein
MRDQGSAGVAAVDPGTMGRPVGPPDVLSVEEAADFLGLSLGSTYTYLRNGTIPARRAGKRWLISRRALAEWLSSPAGSAPSSGSVS